LVIVLHLQYGLQQLECKLQALDACGADQLQIAEGVLDDAGSGAD